MVGTTVGAYRVLAKLGEGGMGEVYRARDAKLARDVALKILPASVSGDPERIARFQREAQLLAALSHPSIAGIYGLEDSGIATVLVMELIEGESLDQRLTRGSLPPDEAIAIATQIGEALGAAHERGIIHRDLKPANIMLTPDGRVKILDFGLAKMIETDVVGSSVTMSPTLSVQATLAGTILGTAPYMSPEQARGRAVDKRTDIWAFGCVLFEMLSGKRAFGGDDVTETIAAIVKSEPDWSALPAAVSSAVVSIVRGCLAKEPRQRYSDIAVPLHLLSTAATEPAVPAAVATGPILRWRRALPTAAAVAAAVLLTGAASWLTRPVPAVPRMVRFVIPLPPGDRTASSLRQAIAISPDGHRVAYVAEGHLYLRDLDATEPQVVRGTDGFIGNLTSPTFSPDGSEIAFWVADDSTLKRVPVTGGAPTTIAPAANPCGLVWEQQGLTFAQAAVPESAIGRAVRAGVDLQKQGILRVSSNGGTPDVVIRVKPDEVACVGASLPGERGRLYWLKKRADSWKSGAVMVRTATGEDKVLVRGASDGRYDGAGHLLYANEGRVMAVALDLDRLEVKGQPVAILDGLTHAVISTSSGVAQYSLAADGTLVYQPGTVQNSDRADIFRLAIFDGKGGIEPLDLPRGAYRGVRVSPDGKTVAYEDVVDGETNIWLQALDLKTAARRLTFGGKQNTGIAWSPDNQWIAFTSDRDGGGDSVYRQRADGTGVAERLTTPDQGVAHRSMSWSPDGTSLLLGARKAGHYDLLVLSLQDGRLSPFSDVSGSSIRTQGEFSPDGRWVVYQRDGASSPAGTVGYEYRVAVQAFVEPFPPTGAKYLVPVKQAGLPFWSRDGARLYFNAGPSAIFQVDVHTRPTVTFSPPRPLSHVGGYEGLSPNQNRPLDTLPDGRLLGIMLDASDGQTKAELHVVVNWLPALTAKLTQ